jgi:hypothetical protein
VTENDVLRELLGLAAKTYVQPQLLRLRMEKQVRPRKIGWPRAYDSPAPTDFRATYKGRTYAGRIQRGAPVGNEKRYDAPSAAAVAIKGNPVNGWRFWECRFPAKRSWQTIDALRR